MKVREVEVVLGCRHFPETTATPSRHAESAQRQEGMSHRLGHGNMYTEAGTVNRRCAVGNGPQAQRRGFQAVVPSCAGPDSGCERAEWREAQRSAAPEPADLGLEGGHGTRVLSLEHFSHTRGLAAGCSQGPVGALASPTGMSRSRWATGAAETRPADCEIGTQRSDECLGRVKWSGTGPPQTHCRRGPERR